MSVILSSVLYCCGREKVFVFVVIKSHLVKGHWCEARKALTKEEMVRFRGGRCCLVKVVKAALLQFIVVDRTWWHSSVILHVEPKPHTAHQVEQVH